METFSSDVLEKQWYVVVILSIIASKYKNGAPSPREPFWFDSSRISTE